LRKDVGRWCHQVGVDTGGEERSAAVGGDEVPVPVDDDGGERFVVFERHVDGRSDRGHGVVVEGCFGVAGGVASGEQ
jgi:hypothetical protein